MRGTFTKVAKWFNQYCFVNGNDGNTYFCHRNDFLKKQDWKYVYDGNSCDFDIVETPDKEHNRAVNIIPVRIPDPRNAEKAERKNEEKRIAAEKAIAKEKNTKEMQRKKETADKWRQHIDEHFHYTIGVRDEETKVWSALRPVELFDNNKECRNAVKELNDSHPDRHYRIMKVLAYNVEGKLVLKELKSKSYGRETVGEFV